MGIARDSGDPNVNPDYEPPPSKGLNIGIPIIIPIQERGLFISPLHHERFCQETIEKPLGKDNKKSS